MSEQDQVWVDHRRRSGKGWDPRVYKSLSDSLMLPDLGCEVALAEMYERVFPAQ